MEKINKKQLKLQFAGNNRFSALLSLMIRGFFYCLNYILNIGKINSFGRKSDKIIS
jgi:hypothetical protein